MLAKSLNRFLTARVVLPAVYRSGGVDRSYAEECNAFERLPRLEQVEAQMARFRRLLRLALEHSPFYADKYRDWSGHIEDLRSPADLVQLPILEKHELRSTETDRFLVRRPRHVRTSRTTGSTGNPVQVLFDVRYWGQALARRARLMQRHGLVLGSREARFWGRGNRPVRRGPGQIVANRQVFQFLGRDADALRREWEEFVAFNPDYCYGYGSLLLRGAQARSLAPTSSPGVRGVIRTAESMNDVQVAHVRDAFNCPVINEYGCSEMEIIGFDCEAGACHVETAHVLLEAALDESGRAEAVVTDLDNDVMPLIRYRLGDYVELSDDPCSCGRESAVIRAIGGRTTDRVIVLPNGDHEHAVGLAHIITDLCDEGFSIVQFRVVQVAIDKLVFILEGTREGEREALARAVAQKVRDSISNDLAVDVEFGLIALTAQQKHTYFVPLDGAAKERGGCAEY